MTIGLLFYVASLTGNEVNLSRAGKVAATTYYVKAHSQNGIDLSQVQTVLLYTCESNGRPIYYVFGLNGLTGFVIVSADDAVYPVIGYSTEGNYAVEEYAQPPAFVSWMQTVKMILLEHITNGDQGNTDILQVWDKMENYEPVITDNPLGAVSPLTTSLWDQGCNYNLSCPATGGVHPDGPCDHVLTGCVATAMAIIMKYWNFPAHGTGSHSYVDPANTTSSCPQADPSYGTISRTFNTNYNWWNMPDAPTNSSTGIPALMVDCGVSVDMNYAYCTSGAWPAGNPVVANSFKNFFYYSSAAADEVRADHTDTEWYNMMKNELNNARPIDYGNQNHSWVCDGYDDNYNGTGQLYFHMNWGWSGGSNGYFTLNSSQVGTLQEAVIGISPSYQPPLAPTNVTASQGEYSGNIAVNWRWASNASHYKVYRNTVNNSGTATAISGWITSTWYEDQTAMPSSTYYYWVKSAASSGGADASGFSPVASGYTADPDILGNDAPILNSETPRYMTFTNSNPYWAVVGVRPAFNTDDWDIRMYTDNTFSTVAASSTYGAGFTDFVLVDGNHTSYTSRGLKINRYSGTSFSLVEFDGGTNMLYQGDNNNIGWSTFDVAKCWDVYLTPGTYEFKLSVNSGNVDAGLAVFSSAGGSYFFGRSGALATVDANGGGLGENLTVTVTSNDYYGFVVWCNNSSASNFNVRIERAGTWTGAVDYNWHNPGNWTADYVPTSDLDVDIPAVAKQPWIWTGDAYCHNLTLEAGAGNYLRVYDHILNITGDATINAELMLDNPVVTAQCTVSGNVYWGSASTGWMTTGTSLNIYGSMEFQAEANVHLTGGSVAFYGSSTSYIYSNENTCYLHDMNIYKSGGAGVWYSTTSTRSLFVNGNLYVGSTSAFVCNADSSLHLGGALYSAGDFHCNYGTVICDGVYPSITLQPSNYFKNLLIAPSAYVDILSDININGDLTITSGILYSNSHTISITGDWNNLVGPYSFAEGSGRVIFNGGNYHQYCSTEDFYILEVNKASGGAFRMQGTNVYCNQYDWTAGAVDVLSGSFTAMNLNDNGISGAFYVNPGGLIELHNPTGYVDLNGDIYIYGGIFDVYGGTTDSYWPYTHNASITMTGGILDFKDVGIRLYTTASYTFSENIIGGTIRTVGSLFADRSEFTPASGLIELYGPSGSYLTTTNGASLDNLEINKDGLQTVIMNSNLFLGGNLTIENGTLASNNNYISVQGDWTNNVGDAGFTEGSGTVNFNGSNTSRITTNESFYALDVNKTYSGVNGLEILSGQTVNVSSALSVGDGTVKLDDNTVLNAAHITLGLGTGLNASAGNVAINLSGNWADFNSVHNNTTGFFPGVSSTVTFYQGTNQTMTTNGSTEPFFNLIINKPSGNFIPSAGVSVEHDFSLLSGTFDCGATGLSHYFMGDMTVVPATAWYACQQTVYFTGSNDQHINFSPNNGYFNNVVLSKTAGSKVIMQSNIISLNNAFLLINAGELDLDGYYYRCTGNITINNGGTINIPASSWLEVGNNSTLAVNNGGMLKLLGSSGSPAMLTHHYGNYDLNIESGGTISAENAVFEYTGVNGIYVKSGAVVDNLHPFTACTFRYGIANGSLMRIDNNQTFTVNNALFPANTWSGTYNVSKTINQGMVNFVNYSGDFGGTTFENDAFGLVNWTPVGGNQLSGILTYDNLFQTPLNNSKVLLKSGTTIVDSTMTNPSGFYTFDNVPAGTYTLDGRCTKPWGGVNSTDALKIMRHFVHITLLTGLRLKVADIDGSNFVNALDALMAMQRFVEIIGSFPTGDWAFEKPGITLTGGLSTKDFKGLCIGDVDGTYTPLAKHESQLQLLSEGIIQAKPGEIVSLPLRAIHDMTVGAVSLDLDILLPGLEIKNITMSQPGKQTYWKYKDGKLRIAWASLEPIELKSGDELLTVDLVWNPNIANPEQGPCFRAGDDCELAGPEAEVLQSEMLALPTLTLSGNPVDFQLGECYPNPFNLSTQVPFYLPEAGVVRIILNDAAGREIRVLDAGNYSTGQHTLSLDRNDLSAGIYSLRMEVTGKQNKYSKAARIVVTR